MRPRDKEQARFGSRTAIVAVAALVGILAFLTYVLTLAPGLLAGDSAEFQFAAFKAGIAHPTGYPLYLILGWIWSHLVLIRDVAWRMNLFSALWGGVTVGLVCIFTEQLLSRALPKLRLTARLLAAAAAGLGFAWSPIFWSSSIVAEIYSLHSTIVALLMVLVLRWEAHLSSPDRQGSKRAASLLSLSSVAIVYGLGLTHHSTTVLLAPALLAFIVLALRLPKASNRRPKTGWAPQLVKLAVLLCTPLLLYSYIPLRAPHSDYLWVNLAEDRVLGLYDLTVPGFFRYVSARVFAGSLLDFGQAFARLGLAWSHILAQLTWVGVSLAAVGLLRLAISRRWRLLVLTGVSFLGLLIFNLFYGIGDVQVLFAAPALLAFAWAGVGIGAAAELISRGFGSGSESAPWSAALVSAVGTALAIGLLLVNRPLVDQSMETAWSDRWRALLAATPEQDAILISNDRDEIMPLWYLQQVEGERPDLTGLFPLIVEGAEWENLGAVIDQVLTTNRQVFLIKPMPGLEVKYDLRTAGALVEVLGRTLGETPEGDVVGELGGRMKLLRADMSRLEEDSSLLQIRLIWQPATALEQDYTSFAHLLDASGNKIAQSDHVPGGLYYPTSAWGEHDVLRDIHHLPMLQSDGDGPYSLAVGFYSFPSMERLGEAILLPITDLDLSQD